MKPIAVGVDVGGTNAKLAVVAPEGRVLKYAQLPTEAAAGPAAFIERLCARLASWKGLGKPAAVGLALAGDVDAERGMLRFTPNLPGWDGYDFKRELAGRLGLPVVVDNDANAAVWGAYAVEFKKIPRNVVGVTLGTGVGGGLVLGGRIYRGSTGSAGEIGHTRVANPGEHCHCGSRGCLEAYVGNYGIARTARRLLAARPKEGKILRRLCPDPAAVTPKHLALAADKGDELSREVWKRTGGMLGLGLANLVLILNPDMLLLLGGVSRAGRWLLDPVKDALSRQPFQTSFHRAHVRIAANPNGGCIGAALLAFERALEK